MPATLWLNSVATKSRAFFSEPEIEWLYSGVTKMKASNSSSFAPQAFVWSLAYIFAPAGTTSSSRGRSKLPKSTTSARTSSLEASCCSTQLTICGLRAWGREVPGMMAMLSICILNSLSGVRRPGGRGGRVHGAEPAISAHRIACSSTLTNMVEHSIIPDSRVTLVTDQRRVRSLSSHWSITVLMTRSDGIRIRSPRTLNTVIP